MMPIMTPNNPRALPKISTIRIFTKVEGVCASARAHPEPVTPTHTPQKRFERPTERPLPKRAKDLYKAYTLDYFMFFRNGKMIDIDDALFLYH